MNGYEKDQAKREQERITEEIKKLLVHLDVRKLRAVYEFVLHLK